MPKSETLTIKQALFVQEYIVDFNASRAALAAKYSKKTAPYIGAENLKKPQIQEAIQIAMKQRGCRVGRTADEVVKRLWDMQDIDSSDYSEKRQIKSIELLMKHYGLFEKDNNQGMTEATLLAILATLPPDQAEKTKQLLLAGLAKKPKR